MNPTEKKMLNRISAAARRQGLRVLTHNGGYFVADLEGGREVVFEDDDQGGTLEELRRFVIGPRSVSR